MNKKIIAVVIVVLAAAGVTALAVSNKKPSTNSTSNTSSNSSSSSQNSQSQQSVTTASEFTVNATDDSADPSTLNVKKGDKITVTFKVSQSGVYHGGLEFKSDVVNSGPIKPGESKTITFTADKSFDFTPFWYESSVQKGYFVSVKVN